ncbi:amidase signature domain-containing protein [Fusarium solani]|uniref:amidase n=1 Tax=Fusarium solani TaxID=169388 RepID=A0A9P9KUB2_FUSSL|nr:amidase signature domain-containing protein [Fusarium solani]KAH7268609.1 amidase signature domain-containing protein [Fusarium solani]
MTIDPPQLPSAPWEARAAEKRARCADAIPKPWRLPSSVLDTLKTPLETSKNDLISLDIPRRSGILTDLELDITEHNDVSGLLAKLADGSFTATQVVTAFSKRAAIAQQLTNCLTETFFDQAQSRAQQLDKLRQDGKLAGPLHGLPVSLKDTFQVVGTQATIGLVAYLDEFSKSNSPLVEILLSLGAVPFVKTNVPQTMMTADSHNNVFGRTLNPRNTALGAGGSSGGEGALIAFRGAPIGVGTDIAGSVRIPSLCCGTYGFKPTAGRIPYGGQRGCSNPGLKFILACAGPLANDMQSLKIFTKAVIDSRPADLDSTAIDVPWRNIPAFSGKKLRLGVLPEDPSYPLHPPVRNAISQAVAKLRAEGHILVDLDPQECLIDGINDVAWGIFALDKTASRIVTDAGEPDIPSRQRIVDELKRLKSDYLPDLTGLSDLDKLATLNIKKAAAVEGWRRIWQSHRLDAVIGPSAQNTAVQHDLFGVPPYTCFLNVLNYPACVIPFGNAKPVPGEDFGLKSDQVGPPYDAELTEGAPCSVQVFTSSMRDEECIAVSSIINNILNC